MDRLANHRIKPTEARTLLQALKFASRLMTDMRKEVEKQQFDEFVDPPQLETSSEATQFAVENKPFTLAEPSRL